MKSRYLFLAVGAVFLAVAALEFLRYSNDVAAAVNAVTGIIFLYLGGIPSKTSPPGARPPDARR
jgi:hypothetical protein